MQRRNKGEYDRVDRSCWTVGLSHGLTVRTTLYVGKLAVWRCLRGLIRIGTIYTNYIIGIA